MENRMSISVSAHKDDKAPITITIDCVTTMLTKKEALKLSKDLSDAAVKEECPKCAKGYLQIFDPDNDWCPKCKAMFSV
jgi:hypothetical protein